MWEWAHLCSRPWNWCVSADQLGRPGTPRPLRTPDRPRSLMQLPTESEVGVGAPRWGSSKSQWKWGQCSAVGFRFLTAAGGETGQGSIWGAWHDGLLFLRSLGVVPGLLSEQVGWVWSEGPIALTSWP